MGPSKRHYGQSMSIAFGVGYCLVTAYAYGFPHWKDLTVACALTSVPVIILMALLPKSARFLYLTGKPDEGWEILKNFAKRTKSTLPDDFKKRLKDHSVAKESFVYLSSPKFGQLRTCESKLNDEKTESKTLTMIDVFKSPKLRITAFLMGFAFIGRDLLLAQKNRLQISGRLLELQKFLSHRGEKLIDFYVNMTPPSGNTFILWFII